MFARWNRMAKQFSRIGKDITISVKKAGPDPGTNSELRRAIQNARAVNMPKDKIESAIKRASGRDAANFEEVMYEGYAPHGVAVLVECATDNPTRTVPSVRNAFNKNGGNLATAGSVSFQFKRMGVFRLNPEGIDQDDLELYLIDHGLEEFGESTGEKGEPQLVARCLFEEFGTLQKALARHSQQPQLHLPPPAMFGLAPGASGLDRPQQPLPRPLHRRVPLLFSFSASNGTSPGRTGAPSCPAGWLFPERQCHPGN